MVAPIIGGMTVGQSEQAKSMIRLLKQYLSETKNDRARRQIAKAVAEMAAELVEMRDGGRMPPPPAPPPRYPSGGVFTDEQMERMKGRRDGDWVCPKESD